MNYLGVFCFFIIISTCYVIARSNAYSNKKAERERRNFWAQESEANSVRKADISNLDYITIPIEQLPIEEATIADTENLIKSLRDLSDKKIINLSGYTNTELKLMYGPANLDILSEYDNNYTTLIKTLDNIAHKLIDNQRATLAKDFLEYSVSIGSDITRTFVTLGEMYAQDKDYEKLAVLKSQAEKITSLSGPSIVTKLNNIKS